jgi:hypothetical protein
MTRHGVFLTLLTMDLAKGMISTVVETVSMVVEMIFRVMEIMAWVGASYFRSMEMVSTTMEIRDRVVVMLSLAMAGC